MSPFKLCIKNNVSALTKEQFWKFKRYGIDSLGCLLILTSGTRRKHTVSRRARNNVRRTRLFNTDKTEVNDSCQHQVRKHQEWRTNRKQLVKGVKEVTEGDNSNAKRNGWRQVVGTCSSCALCSELSGRDGALVPVEFCEEHPPLISQVGMPTKLKSHYKRTATKDSGPKPLKYREIAYAHTSPFLGILPPGATQPVVENNI